MPAKKTPRLRRPSQSEIEALTLFCNSLGVDVRLCWENPVLLEVPGGAYSDVFDIPLNVMEFLESALGGVAYSAGYYVGSLDRNTMEFKPTLPLAHRLAPYCESMPCCRVDDDAEVIFLYGKDILEEHILNVYHAKRAESICLVTNKLGEALGWGRLVPAKSKRGRKLRLVAVKDLGWYLRRGG